mmetsp:Transcript_155376/g.270393  ORF Transcript_155376/g.270393 Transcript_155376/m.270393 type:complete len:385 (+) Transcript_155376:90-1244(+)
MRVELLCECQAKKGQKATAIVEANYNAIFKAACSKFRIQKKNLVLYTRGLFHGTKVLSPEDLTGLEDGALVILADRQPDLKEERQFSDKAKKAINELSWVQVGPGRLAARGYPSPEILLALKEKQGLTCVVSLICDGERDEEAKDENHGCLAEIRDACQRLGVKWTHAPLLKRESVEPGEMQPQNHTSLCLAAEVEKQLQSGESVMVHCSAGLHRTGVYLYLLLRLSGASPEEAMTQIPRIRKATHDEMLIWFAHDGEKGKRACKTKDKDKDKEAGTLMQIQAIQVAVAEERRKKKDTLEHKQAASAREGENQKSTCFDSVSMTKLMQQFNLYTSAELIFSSLFGAQAFHKELLCICCEGSGNLLSDPCPLCEGAGHCVDDEAS